MDKLIPTPNFITLQPNPPLGNEKVPLLSNPIPEPEFSYLAILAFN